MKRLIRIEHEPETEREVTIPLVSTGRRASSEILRRTRELFGDATAP